MLRVRFDLLVLFVILALLASIAVVIARGDQIGLGVRRFAPVNSASSQVNITIDFDDPVDPAAAAPHIVFTPPFQASFSRVESEMFIRPDRPLPPGQTYTVTIRAGLPALSGRTVKQDVHWQFQVRQPRVLYLAPTEQGIPNLFVVSADGRARPQQLTRSENGIVEYDVTPAGDKLAYTETVYADNRRDGVTQFYLLDPTTGAARFLYNCDAICTNLRWRPDGGALAFQRVDLDEKVGNGPGAARIWLFDLAENTAQPLFQDNQVIGYGPQWSPDGTRLAFYSPSAGGILIHNFADNHDLTIPAPDGEPGSFSPDGRWLSYPRGVTLANGNAAVHLMLIQLSGDSFAAHDLDRPDDPVNEVEAVWRADSQGLIAARQPSLYTVTEGTSLFDVNLATGASTRLVPEDGNNQEHLALSPDGGALLFQRDTPAFPQTWLYDLSSHELKRVMDDATSARWLP